MENRNSENIAKVLKMLDKLIISVSENMDWQGTLTPHGLFRIVSLLGGDRLDDIIVPALGVPVRLNSFDYAFNEVEKIFDSYPKTMPIYANRIQKYQIFSKMEAIPKNRIDDVTSYGGMMIFILGIKYWHTV